MKYCTLIVQPAPINTQAKTTTLVSVATAVAERPDGMRGHERFGKSDHVHGHGNGLSQEEDQANRPAELDPQAAADEVVCPAPFDARVRGDGREREAWSAW